MLINKKKINVSFNESPIAIKDIKVDSFINKKITGIKSLKSWKRVGVGCNFSYGCAGASFSYLKVNPLRPLATMTATSSYYTHWNVPYFLHDDVFIKASSFPVDYKFKYYRPIYILGMSVPPLMMHKLSQEVVNQLF